MRVWGGSLGVDCIFENYYFILNIYFRLVRLIASYWCDLRFISHFQYFFLFRLIVYTSTQQQQKKIPQHISCEIEIPRKTLETKARVCTRAV